MDLCYLIGNRTIVSFIYLKFDMFKIYIDCVINIMNDWKAFLFCAHTQVQSCILAVTELLMFISKYSTIVVYLCKYPTVVEYFVTESLSCLFLNTRLQSCICAKTRLQSCIFLQRIPYAYMAILLYHIDCTNYLIYHLYN